MSMQTIGINRTGNHTCNGHQIKDEEYMNRLDVTFEEFVSFDNLLLAYRNARKCKRFRGETLEFTAHLTEELIQLQNELIWNEYKVSKYREKQIRIPKPRVIMALQFRDRVCQWAIYQILNPYFDKRYIYDSYGCRKGKGTVKARERLQYWLRKANRSSKKYYILKLDISKYFYRIDHEILLSILSEYIKDKRILSLLDTIINCEDCAFGIPSGVMPECLPKEEWIYERGMPIGNLTSQMFMNIYLNELDQYIKHKLNIHSYIRFADDIIIILDGKDKLNDVKYQVEQFLNDRLHLDLNNKTAIIPAHLPVEFVGAKISYRYIKMRKSTVRRMRKGLKHVSKVYASGQISFIKANNTFQSYFGMLKHCNASNLINRITNEYVLKHENQPL